MLVAVVMALTFTLGFVANDGGSSGAAGPSDQAAGDAPASSGDVSFETLDDIVGILENDYVGRDGLDEQALYQAAINGMLGTLADTGTFYVDPSVYQTAVGPSGTFEGIGATVSEKDNEIIIAAPIANSPAEQAGLESGDAILAVNGQTTQGWTVDKAVLEIRGPKGTEVTLTIRKGDGTTKDLTIVRDEIRVESVTTVPPGGVLQDSTGNDVSDLAYIHIAEFSQRTPDELEPLIREAEESGKAGIILDLRFNPGGLLRETVEVADMFLNDSTVLIEVDRNDNEHEYRAEDGGAALNIPIVILMNQYSASGAEVLASALRDNGRAVIVGEKSFGKGTVNIAHPLDDGGALFVTIARWLTPKGKLIDDVGIEPDVQAPLDGPYDPLRDVQIYKAIDELRSIVASAAAPAP
jgi:carboxyl-terminal processing protease